MHHATAGKHRPGNFRRFFFRGLALVLPTVLTIWILALAYSFVQKNIAEPINRGLRWAVVMTGVPEPTDRDRIAARESLTLEERSDWSAIQQRFIADTAGNPNPAELKRLEEAWLEPYARRAAILRYWNSVTLGQWRVLDVLGLVLAIILIYMMGALLGGYIGSRIVKRVEELLRRVPLIRNVYPAVKQLTDFLVGAENEDEQHAKAKFSRVVAVQYPRKGIWSIGLVTGATMRTVERAAGQPCLTIFIPNSPTPFTGFVITVPREDTIDLPLSIEEALKAIVSLGVVIPPGEVTNGGGAKPAPVALVERAAEAPPG